MSEETTQAEANLVLAAAIRELTAELRAARTERQTADGAAGGVTPATDLPNQRTGKSQRIGTAVASKIEFEDRMEVKETSQRSLLTSSKIEFEDRMNSGESPGRSLRNSEKIEIEWSEVIDEARNWMGPLKLGFQPVHHRNLQLVLALLALLGRDEWFVRTKRNLAKRLKWQSGPKRIGNPLGYFLRAVAREAVIGAGDPDCQPTDQQIRESAKRLHSSAAGLEIPDYVFRELAAAPRERKEMQMRRALAGMDPELRGKVQGTIDKLALQERSA